MPLLSDRKGSGEAGELASPLPWGRACGSVLGAGLLGLREDRGGGAVLLKGSGR